MILACPAVAHAGRAVYQTGTGTIEFTDTTGQFNRLVITRVGPDIVDIVDTGVGSVQSGAGCPVHGSGVRCTFPGDSPTRRMWIEFGDQSDTAVGGAIDTVWIDGEGDDAITGGSGEDRFNSDLGSDVYRGGAGVDSVDYRDGVYAPTGVVVDLDGLADDGGPGEGDLIGPDVENLGGSFGPDRLTGNDGDNQIVGFDGDDVLDGGGGHDDVFGGFGRDLVTYASHTGLVRVDADCTDGIDAGTDCDDPTTTGDDGGTLDGPVGLRDTVSSTVEDLRGGAAGDTLTGTSDANLLEGGPGSDLLDGGGGADELQGQDGNDLLSGGAGPDLLRGGAGVDVLLDWLGTSTTVVVTLDDLPGDGPAGENDDAGSDVETVYGSSATDRLVGGTGSQQLFGEGGGDVLDGGDDGDRLMGGAGDDELFGGAGADDLDGGADGDSLAGDAGADTMLGGDGDDALAARDGVADAVVDCGAGTDGAVVDELDPPTVGCETEDRPGSPPAPGGGGGGGGGAGGGGAGGGVAVPTPGGVTGGGTGSPGTPGPAPPPSSGGSSPADATAASGAAAKGPAKLQVLRAGVRGGRLDVLAQLTRRARGSVRVRFSAAGRTTSFRAAIDPKTGRVRIGRRLPAAHVRMGTGILRLRYPGSARVRPDDVRLRAANGRARLQRRTAELRDGRLVVGGTVSDRARGVVRIRMGYVDAGGALRFLHLRAPIRAGRWALSDDVPDDAAARGGQLSIQFTGYLARGIRGEQDAKQVLPR